MGMSFRGYSFEVVLLVLLSPKASDATTDGAGFPLISGQVFLENEADRPSMTVQVLTPLAVGHLASMARGSCPVAQGQQVWCLPRQKYGQPRNGFPFSSRASGQTRYPTRYPGTCPDASEF